MITTIKSVCRSWPIQCWVSLFLAASLLAVPMSSTGKSICVGIAVALITLSPVYRRALLDSIFQPWCQAVLLLFFIALIACFWSPASILEQGLVLEKYSKLLYLPILAVGFRDERARRAGLHAFLLAMGITCLISILKFFDVIQYGSGYRLADAGDVFRNHIMTGYMMAFAAYLSGLFFLQQRRTRVRFVYALLGLLYSYQVLFINTGRTGYVIYLLLMLLLMVQMFSWRQAMVAFLLIGLLFTVSFYHSPVMQAGIKQATVDWNLYHQHDKDTPIGFRLQFHDYAHGLFNRHPWIGNGTASFTYFFREENPVQAWSRRLLEPHSQYWMTASEFGLLGLCAFAFFFISLLLASLKLNQMRPIAIALLLSFLVGNLSDSLLFYSGTGYFFILFMALCLGERMESQRTSSCQ